MKLIVARRAEEVGSLSQAGGIDGMLAKRGLDRGRGRSGKVEAKRVS